MDCRGGLQLILTVFISVQLSSAQRASIACLPTDAAGSEFEFIFKYVRDGDTQVTGLQSYSAAEAPLFNTIASGVGCSSTDVDDDSLILSLAVDVDGTLPCGAVQDAVTSTMYHFAIGPAMTSTVYTFTCDTNQLLATEVTLDDFSTGHVQSSSRTMFDDQAEVGFQILTPRDVEVTSVRMGEPIKLRLTHDNTPEERDLLGRVFHTGLPHPLADGARLEIYTLSSLGATVHVTGTLAGKQIDTTVEVTRSRPVTVTIPDAYYQESTRTDWRIFTKGLKIESVEREIGVILRSHSGDVSAETALVVHPDDILGTAYRLAYCDDTKETRVAVIGTADSTDVTFDLVDYSEKANGLTIAGTLVTTLPTHTVTLHEHDVLEVVCLGCSNIRLSATGPIAVTLGRHYDGIVQLPGADNLYQDFLLHNSVLTKRVRVSFMWATDPGANVDLTYSDRERQLAGKGARATLAGLSLYAAEPIYTQQEAFGLGATSFAYMYLPAVAQWNTRYHFYLHRRLTYTVVIATTVPHLAQITLDGDPVGDMAAFATTTIDPPLGSSGNAYETFAFDVVIDDYGAGWRELSSASMGVSFGVYAVEKPSGRGDIPVPLLPFGVLFPCVTASGAMDHDCDREASTQPSPLDVELLVTGLVMSDSPTFSRTRTILTHGCNVNSASSIVSDIGHFTRSTRHVETCVLDTSVFRAFRFRSSSNVYFRLDYQFCFGGSDECISTCRRRRKRSTSHHHTELTLTVQDGRNTTLPGTGRRSCRTDAVYWGPHFVLMLIILTEALTIMCILLKTYTLKLAYSTRRLQQLGRSSSPIRNNIGSSYTKTVLR